MPVLKSLTIAALPKASYNLDFVFLIAPKRNCC